MADETETTSASTPPTDPPTQPAPRAASAAPVSDPVADLGAANAALESVDADLASAQASIDELLKQANFEDPATLGTADIPTQAFDLPSFADTPRELPGGEQ